ncbi:dysbindin protein homolog [Nilaparvata lugens]|uniref:dysbindin protein homolog n=1 Tax=Nilaparvata lugens TaxID=108931 RepID=UPI000B99374D|nr:dysbindin protein homolog [Nilaparvata lugens]
MFDSLRDKLQSVQEGISASFRGLAVGEIPQTVQIPEKHAVNINAGGEILQHYQRKWNELHAIAEENAIKAQDVDDCISSLEMNVTKKLTSIENLNSQLVRIPQVIDGVHSLIRNIGTLQNSIDKVEKLLIQLEDIVETQHMQEEQLEKRFELAMYREKKLADLDNVRSNLSVEHAVKLSRHEKRLSAEQKEKQATYGEAFKNDIEHYKKFGSIPHQKTIQSANLTETPPCLSLEEVVLDDNQDREALDELLKDSELE